MQSRVLLDAPEWQRPELIRENKGADDKSWEGLPGHPGTFHVLNHFKAEPLSVLCLYFSIKEKQSSSQMSCKQWEFNWGRIQCIIRRWIKFSTLILLLFFVIRSWNCCRNFQLQMTKIYLYFWKNRHLQHLIIGFTKHLAKNILSKLAIFSWIWNMLETAYIWFPQNFKGLSTSIYFSSMSYLYISAYMQTQLENVFHLQNNLQNSHGWKVHATKLYYTFLQRSTQQIQNICIAFI